MGLPYPVDTMRSRQSFLVEFGIGPKEVLEYREWVERFRKESNKEWETRVLKGRKMSLSDPDRPIPKKYADWAEKEVKRLYPDGYKGGKHWSAEEILQSATASGSYAPPRYPITVLCDYCEARYPFDLMEGGKLICRNCGHDVNTKKGELCRN